MISPIVSSGDRLEREAVAKQAGPKKRTNNTGNTIAKRNQLTRKRSAINFARQWLSDCLGFNHSILSKRHTPETKITTWFCPANSTLKTNGMAAQNDYDIEMPCTLRMLCANLCTRKQGLLPQAPRLRAANERTEQCEHRDGYTSIAHLVHHARIEPNWAVWTVTSIFGLP